MMTGINMKVFNRSTIGESHIADKKPCQDYSLSYISESGISIAIVSDGHGGKSYFRSQIGSETACHVAKECLESFVNNVDKSFYAVEGKEGVKILPLTAIEHPGKIGQSEEQLRQLSKSIIHKWRQEIDKDAKERELTEWEISNATEEDRAQLSNDKTRYRAYGCTLMAFVTTPDYWVALHLGDGKCIAFHDASAGMVWNEPLPWDDKCFLNKTTSLCANDAYESFRFAYGGVESMPLAVFLGSDGLDDTFGDTDLLCDFYIKVLKEILFSSQESVEAELDASLSLLSRKGSLDDMSIACIYDEERLCENINSILEHQISLVTQRISSSQRRVKELVARKEGLVKYLEVKDKFFLFRKEKEELERTHNITSNTNLGIEIGFADKDVSREEKHQEQLSQKQQSLMNEREKLKKILLERASESCANADADANANVVDSTIETNDEVPAENATATIELDVALQLDEQVNTNE